MEPSSMNEAVGMVNFSSPCAKGLGHPKGHRWRRRKSLAQVGSLAWVCSFWQYPASSSLLM